MMQSVALTDSCQHDDDYVVVDAETVRRLLAPMRGTSRSPRYHHNDAVVRDDDEDSYDYCDDVVLTRSFSFPEYIQLTNAMSVVSAHVTGTLAMENSIDCPVMVPVPMEVAEDTNEKAGALDMIKTDPASSPEIDVSSDDEDRPWADVTGSFHGSKIEGIEVNMDFTSIKNRKNCCRLSNKKRRRQFKLAKKAAAAEVAAPQAAVLPGTGTLPQVPLIATTATSAETTKRTTASSSASSSNRSVAASTNFACANQSIQQCRRERMAGANSNIHIR